MIYFLVYLFAEIFVSLKIASALGPFWTFVEVITSAVAGLLLLTNFRYTFFENMQALMARRITPETFQNQNFAAILGALLLIVPGFLTDLIGILLQFGVFARLLAARMHGSKRGRPDIQTHSQPYEGETDVIDVEIIDDPRSGR